MNTKTKSANFGVAFASIVSNLGVLIFSAGASAQTCQMPSLLPKNVAVTFNTCQLNYAPQFICGSLQTTGPSAVFSLNLAYPDGATSITVAPAMGSQFDPTLLIETSACADSDCPFAIDNGGSGGAEQFFVSPLYSGHYYVWVTSVSDNPNATCGAGTVIFGGNLGDGNESSEGVFRGGFQN